LPPEPLGLGVDLGTSGLRLALIDPSGQVLVEQSSAYPAPFEDPTGWREGLITLCAALPGELRARVLIDGRESTLATMEVGECFGELAVIDESTRSADVLSNTESVVLKISSDALKKLFREAPALAAPFLLGLSRTLTGRIRHLTKRFEDSVHFARTAQG